MPLFSYNNIKISGIASAVPTKLVKSTDYSEKFGEETVSKFIEMTGIKEHRQTLEHQTASDLGFVAADFLLKEKKIDRESIGALIFGAHSTDFRRPATACVLHKRLGLTKNCAAFDVNLGCSAFVYAATIASSLLATSDIQKVLVIVGETMTKMTSPDDRSSIMLFGDGGSAILLEKAEENSSIKSILKSDGNGWKSIICPSGGFRNMVAPTEFMMFPDGYNRSMYKTYMNGTDVFSFTISDVPKTIKEFFEKTETSVDDYDCFAMHQANQFIHKQLAKKIKIPMEKMPLSLDRFGNTSAPAIPLTLCDKYGNDTDSKELNTLMCGFGVGLSWGVVSAKINTADIYPIIETDDYFKEGIINSPEDL